MRCRACLLLLALPRAGSLAQRADRAAVVKLYHLLNGPWWHRNANWDVDKGEIVRKIFDGEGAEGLFDEMMYEVNFDGLREQLMANLLYRLRTSEPEERASLSWMVPRLRDIISEEPLPFLNSLDKRASLALMYLEGE